MRRPWRSFAELRGLQSARAAVPPHGEPAPCAAAVEPTRRGPGARGCDLFCRPGPMLGCRINAGVRRRRRRARRQHGGPPASVPPRRRRRVGHPVRAAQRAHAARLADASARPACLRRQIPQRRGPAVMATPSPRRPGASQRAAPGGARCGGLARAHGLQTGAGGIARLRSCFGRPRTANSVQPSGSPFRFQPALRVRRAQLRAAQRWGGSGAHANVPSSGEH